ncbi:MAG: NAD-dependent epimerase/dehydratase family protein [bacterium]
MKILVTGAAGFIASHVVARLLKDGHEVTGIDSFDVYYPRSQKEKNLLPLMLHPQFKFMEDNLSTMPLVKVQKGTEAIVHLAAQPGVRGSWGTSFNRYVANNIQVTQKLLEEFKGSKLKRFVYASSSSVYGDVGSVLSEEMRPEPKSPYGVSKLAAEQLCQLYHREYKMPTVALRFFSVYGPGQRPDMAFHRFCQSILREAAVSIYGDGQQVRDYTYVEDVAEVVSAALTVPDAVGQVVNVGGGSASTLLEALSALEEISGRACPRTFLERQKGDAFSTRADTAKLERIFGFKPKVSLKEGLARQWEWMNRFVQNEDEERAIKANIQPITEVDHEALAEFKADEKAAKKAARKAKSAKPGKAPAEPVSTEEPPAAS